MEATATNCLRKGRFADAELAGQRDQERRCRSAPQLFAPVSQIGLGEGEMSLARAGRNEVTVRRHLPAVQPRQRSPALLLTRFRLELE